MGLQKKKSTSTIRPTDYQTIRLSDYQTYGKEDDADYALDHNGEYQPSDYDDMEETRAGNSIREKVSLTEYLGSLYIMLQAKTKKLRKYCACVAVFCVTVIALSLVGIVLHITSTASPRNSITRRIGRLSVGN